MRKVLVDFARSRDNEKRGAGRCTSRSTKRSRSPTPLPDFVALDEALERSPRSIGEGPGRRTAVFWRAECERDGGRLADVAETVMRDWKFAKAWLLRELNPKAAHGV